MSLTKPSLALLAIATAVLLAHLALLQRLPALLQVQAPIVVRTLTTRTIATPLPVAATPAAPRPVPKKPIRKAAPRPSPPDDAPSTSTVAVAELPEPAPVEPLPTPPVPETPASAPVPLDAPPPPERAASAPLPTVPLTHATRFAFPDPVHLLYTLTGESKKLHYSARGELLWKQDGHSYEATLQASMLFIGSRTRTSTGSITPEGLAPQRFSDKWRTEVAAHFDQANHRVSFSANTPDVPLETAAQDQLSVILQIAGILAAEPASYPPAATIAIQTVGPKDADVWIFTVEGPEKIYVPYDGIDTLKLTRNPRKAFDQKVEIWLAPGMGYVPARLKITNANGDYIDQQLRAVEKP
ncbi:DUF3108 domain-containing protein [Rhodoferax sp.]|uniref:DUF3108 domain-containing protein n=1 Tax=Rhodoferax sp. TaxID=50421 RepID=UPI0025ECFE56|nr:DUF3108 domain-containing protein [Rhodoferax sp.]